MGDVKSTGKQLKALVSECTGDLGSILSRPKFVHFKDNGDKERCMLAIQLTTFLMKTTYFTRETKAFISNPYISKADVAREMSELGMYAPESSVATRIRVDLIKFERDFGSRVVIDIFEDMSASLDKYFLKLVSIESSKNKDKCVLDDLRGLIIPMGVPIGDKEISDDRVDTFLKSIEPYTSVQLSKVERSLDREVAFYLRNLLTKGAVGDKEKQHLEKVKSLFDDRVKVI